MHELSSKWRAPKGRKRKGIESRVQAALQARRQARQPKLPNPAPRKIGEPGPSQETPAPKPTASKRKLAQFEEILPLTALQPTEKALSDYTLVSRFTLEEMFSSVVCHGCQKQSLKVTCDIKDRQGFAEKLVVICEDCGITYYQGYTSPRVVSSTSTRPPFAVNRAMTEAFLGVGLGYRGMETLCASLGMLPLSSRTFYDHLSELLSEIDTFRDSVLSAARQIVKDEYKADMESLPEDSIIDIDVSYDGSWQKRGFTSLYGLGCVVDLKTGLIVGYEILSKYCHSCLLAQKSMGDDTEEYKNWQTQHEESKMCSRNYSGSLPAMEVETATRLWQRSVKEWQVRYTTMLSDGDAKTYSTLQKLEPYGPEHKIEKEECQNHLSKRMYTGQKKVVSDARVKGVTLGGTGAGQLTDKVMVKLTSYYKLAISKNRDSVPDMKNAILATLYHSSSTDENPMHQYCPKDESSWCFYNKSVAQGETPPPHKMSLFLNQRDFKHLLPLYERLSDESLLQRCQRGGTQNINEATHSQIWHKVPKEVFVCKPRLELGVLHAIAEFNMGRHATYQMMWGNRGIPVPAATASIAKKKDEARMKKSEAAPVRLLRKKKISQKAEVEKKKIRKEGATYGAGKF